jgi:hypothetical protein
MDHNGIVAVTAKDPDLEEVPCGGGPDHHHEIVVTGVCAVHLVSNCVEDVFVADPVLSSDIRDPR